ncbi:ATP-binding cassette domain-containing protein [Nonomuraea roseoviolacea subsp. roseoviolacea]|uniref:ABC transport system ATP-binding protein n=1 Tax=Nonomuraea roseoviolacea subsp. carminata TaxID=160689 RepID=A0ABT1KCW6_9ACTN|nr:ABC transporter ATP-binding protein [Nonomuraea roseoviolacea]MCP2351857.1 putative ABC transport system ATP-binding protein [Nonomuraea roseoviolacea subsp. carminata]
MTALVACQELARVYGHGANALVAVHEVTCELCPGDQVAITGPSGSGKTTLLHLLAGLDRPTAGRIGWPAFDDRPRGRVGVVFQGPSLLPPLNVVENVALPLLIAGLTDIEAKERALAALDAIGLADLAGSLPEELSGGQAQRVAVARVLAAGPRLIVADEPTAQLDSDLARQVVDLLTEVAYRLDAALVVATHDLRVAARLPKTWTMSDGALAC